MNSASNSPAGEAPSRPRSPAPVIQSADYGDANTARFAGTVGMLRELILGDQAAVPTALDGAVTVLGKDGMDWELWGTPGEWMAIRASRPRTAVERTAWIDRMNGRVSTDYFSRDRQQICTEIACQLFELAGHFAGDRHVSRAARRRMRKQLEVFSTVQLRLTCSSVVDMADCRRQLAAVGLDVQQPNFIERMEATVH